MKTLLLLLVIIAAFMACNSHKQIAGRESPELSISPDEQDSTKYELIVFESGYETFLVSQAKPKWYYSNSYYKNWNIQYVTEWNYRYNNPLKYGNFYETEINYNPSVDYGIDLNYRLYQYFQFIEKEYGIVLIPRRGSTKTNHPISENKY